MLNYKRLEGGLRTRELFNRESTPDRPLLSIITVCRNSEKYLEHTIQSVINQTYDNIEYIIIDGASTDGTLSIIKKYENHIAYWMSEPDRNMYDAMNKGLYLMSGEYWAILNSDDYYFPDTIQKVIFYFKRHPEKEVVSGSVKLVDANGKYIVTWYSVKFNVKSMIRMKTNGIISHPATFLHKTVVEKVGNFNVEYPVISDYDFLIRVGLKCSVGNSRNVLVNSRSHKGKMSLNESSKEQKEENRRVIVSYYRKKYNVNMGLVWWDYYRIIFNNPIYVLKAFFRRLMRHFRILN